MANPHRQAVDVELGGETRQLRYTLNALAEIEEKLGLSSINEILNTIKALSMRSLRTMLWAGLLHARPELTEREVGEMEFDFPHVVERLSRAISLAFGTDAADAESAGGTEGNARRPGRGTGARR